ncbi:hypothetical protein [Bacillus atrophaeus]|uniref:hypothetical protein n=1 Tax=Bacillus atrophaeus TaxID=1452 RepID=UPI00227FE38A|nr:hypothetical protein [Bacillus atrophaeus]MCY8922233.1 hypothetical protein [Bacillus atrophaeus]
MEKSVAQNIKEKPAIKSTGFWTFFNNPKVWTIDDFLISNPNRRYIFHYEFGKKIGLRKVNKELLEFDMITGTKKC